MNAINLAGLIIGFLVIVFLVLALIFPERF
ncbi:F subunit of K+-transporting ATPase (Potass_KdpF) [Asanoa ishikariensis]|uniref:F subunit of K+-transporting ATPase (Potass_KdpF) n=1 Tax=Asanoa ishikariensis TaxID=137265 RepID=A0A1H3R5Y2_9ACTN|nr:potassium-transporting ATPase subunit F [Asanoa ishikariensis]SDZ20725.1 F subunit of K+-transporting ATPase (Potass_KdpF) [Asanoa ishikariensis]